MSPRRHDVFRCGTWVLACAGIVGASAWVYQNRVALAAACLNTVDGVTSKLAHLSQPFGSGAAVQPKNPTLGVVPEFSLTERSGRAVGRADLLGSYWVASFVFTRCATSCPMATAELAKLQAELPEDVRLVSFSVDPEHDSPQVLATYADRVGADVDRWLFLTGAKAALYRLVREGFHLAVEENAGGPPGWEVTHTPRFALVDPKGRIRGYYESSDAVDLDRLRADIARLRGSEPENSPAAARGGEGGGESSMIPR